MKFQKVIFLIAVICASFATWADAGNVLITFSTKGPDYYGDGKTVVKDGEWYALVWTANAAFGGLSSDCNPVVAGDRLLLMAPLAAGGRCPTVVFQVDSKAAPKGGIYSVILLDTRDVSGMPAARNAQTGHPSVLNGTAQTTVSTTAGVGSGDINVTQASVRSGDGAWTASPVEDAYGVPRITSFCISGDKAFIKVANLHSSARYNVFTGSSLDDIEVTTLELPISSEKNDVEFAVDREKGNFFKVDRQPIDK